MVILSLLQEYTWLTILSLIVLCFMAGFIDAVVGGGGLIQLPALLINFPKTPLPILFGTGKIASLAGTSIATVQYAKRVRFNYKLLLCISSCAALSSFIGARCIHLVPVHTLKPLILIILILIAIYTWFKKDLGNVATKQLPFNQQLGYGALIGLVIGFYDGFFGPGTGSFLVLGFVVILGFEFLVASAYAKVVNCVTNVFALVVFIQHQHYILELAIVLAVCNVSGNIVGTRLALKKGNQFIRVFFLIIVFLMILRYSYDIFMAE